MPFVIAPLSKIKGENNYPGYDEAMKALQSKAFSRAQVIWKGFSPGGINPGAGQFGLTTIRPNEMSNNVTSSTASGSYSFNRNRTGGAWRSLWDFTTREGIIMAIAGFRITDDTLRIAQIRYELGDRKSAIMDLQEAMGWQGGFDIIFNQDRGQELVLDPQTYFYVRGYVESSGNQRIVPLGFMLYKTKDLVMTEL
ncbi:MAG: hypothetical protein Q8R31_05915 [Candidatus Omnitrophota bacterium]|nr:hypothetical protein [Candidatus Omnitrophota bacterium]